MMRTRTWTTAAISALALTLTLFAGPALAGPVTLSSFTDAPLPAWAEPFVPGDARTLSAGPFAFADASGDWAFLTEQTGCGSNRVGWTSTPSSSGTMFVSGDVGSVTAFALPDLIALTYQIDDGELWTSTDSAEYVYFTVFEDDDAYYVGMMAQCANEPPSEPADRTDGTDTYPVQYPPYVVRPFMNVALIKLIRRTTPPPVSSVPEPAAILLVATGLAVAYRRRK